MIWLVSMTWLALLLAFGIGAVTSSTWWLVRQRGVNAEFEKRRLLAEAESDHLRLQLSVFESGDDPSESLHRELDRASAEASKVPRLTFEVKHLRERVGLIEQLEQELIDLRADTTLAAGAGGPALESAEPSAEDEKEATPEQIEVAEVEVAEIEVAEVEVAEVEVEVEVVDVRPDAADEADDLTRIRGIGRATERRLNGVGIITWVQLANLSVEDMARVAEAMPAFPGRIRRDRWVEQAAVLARLEPMPNGTNSNGHGSNGSGSNGTATGSDSSGSGQRADQDHVTES